MNLNISQISVFESSESRILKARHWPVEKISLVVPIYRELENENLPNLLASLQRQSFDFQKLHVLLLVNNSIEIANDPESSILKENQKTLGWLSEIIESRVYPFEISFMDLSTRGIERNMGRIRQLGVQFLADAASASAPNHIVVQMDCDTRFSEDFLARLTHRYEAFADLDVIFSTLGCGKPILVTA